MDQNGSDYFGMALHFPQKRSDFGEIGAGTHYIDDFEATVAHEIGEWRKEGGKAGNWSAIQHPKMTV
jgi:hypothetical protein